MEAILRRGAQKHDAVVARYFAHLHFLKPVALAAAGASVAATATTAAAAAATSTPLTASLQCGASAGARRGRLAARGRRPLVVAAGHGLEGHGPAEGKAPGRVAPAPV